MLLDREETVEPGLHLQGNESGDRKVEAIDRLLVAALERLPESDERIDRLHPGHGAGDAAAMAVHEQDAARTFEDARPAASRVAQGREVRPDRRRFRLEE